MTRDPSVQKKFNDLVQSAIRDGKDGRAEIVQQLSVLPLEKLASVPATVLAMIGPEGLASLAARRTEFSGLAPNPHLNLAKRNVPVTSETAPMRPISRWRLPASVWVSIFIIIATLTFEEIVAFAGSSVFAGSLPVNAAEWPRCLRLDRRTDGCVYQTGGGDLSLTRAAKFLQIDVNDLSRLNRHMAIDIGEPLPAGSLIVFRRAILTP